MKNFFAGLIKCGSILLIIILLALSVACNSTTTPSPTSTPSPTTSATPSPTATVTPTPSTAPPVISTNALSDGVVGTSYSQTLQATGGTGAHTWGISSGLLPIGLTLDAKSGTISGTPSAAASYFFTVLAIDSLGVNSNQALAITVNLTPALASALIITTNALPDGNIGNSYNQTLKAIGGSSPYTWSVISGALPTGIRLDANTGVISGVPTAAGSSNFSIEAKDNSGSNAIQSLTLTVSSQPTPTPTASPAVSPSASPSPTPSPSSTGKPANLVITTSSFPAGVAGTSYSQTISYANGTGPNTWSYTRGSLPAGLFLDAKLGIIFGTPTAAGTSYFLVQVTDSNGASSTQSLSITINNK